MASVQFFSQNHSNLFLLYLAGIDGEACVLPPLAARVGVGTQRICLRCVVRDLETRKAVVNGDWLFEYICDTLVGEL